MNYPQTSIPPIPNTEIQPEVSTYRKLDMGSDSKNQSMRYSSKLVAATSKKLRVEDDDDEEIDKPKHKHRLHVPEKLKRHKKPKEEKPKILGRVARMQKPDWMAAVAGIVASIIVGGQ